MEKISKATIRLWMPNKLIKFLKKNGALTSFIDETWKMRLSQVALKNALIYKEPIAGTIDWYESEKGLTYWSKLNNKYVEEYGNDK